MNLTGKTWLVTGASHGLGKAFAMFCAKHDATVILLASNERALEQCYDEIKALGKQKPFICTFNLETATAENYQNLLTHLKDNQIKLDGLFHGAGQLKTLSPIEHTPLHQWHRLMQININAKFALTQTLLPLLKTQDEAKLMFLMSDRAFEKGQAYWSTYQVTETATRTFFEILSEELKDSNIQVNAINAPDCNTRLRKQAFPFEDNKNLPMPNQLEDLWEKCFDEKISHGEIISR
jgi:short-subunit dehydrogenase